jgi:hypothetical protein
MTSRINVVLSIIVVIAFSTIPLVFAGNRWNNPRDLDPVVVSGYLIIGLTGTPINEIYVYAYDAGQDNWRPIPFQIDEKDNTSDYWLANPNGIFDGNDELVFMAKDMGDQAPDGSFWIDDPISQDTRLEIIVTDTLDNSEAYAYVYRTTNPLQLAPESYLEYVAAHPDSAEEADSVIAKTYIENHKKGGIPTDWKLLDGSGEDILDRQKVRLHFKLLGLFDSELSETVLESDENTTITLNVKVGKVRIIRDLLWHVDIMGIALDFNLPLSFYPFSIESGGVSRSIDAGDYVYFIRQSFDLNQQASGMRLYNPYNRNGILINGTGGNDGIVDTIDDPPAINWWLITGNQGSFAIVFRMSLIGDTRKIYYLDNSQVNTDDTGDYMSWGDTGIKISSNQGKYIDGNIRFSYTAYYLGPNKSPSLGDTLATNFNSPLKIQYHANSFVPVELAFFHAMDTDGKVILEWVTATETNNFGFEIQRKKLDNDNWKVIGTVEGKGTTTTPHKYSFTDQSIDIGSYYYRLKQIDFDGSFEFSDEIQVEVKPPKTFSLYQNYPNPFNPATIIRYRIPRLEQATIPVELKIYNLLGDEVRSLVQQDQGTGYYAARWDGKNSHGENVAAGTYIYRLRAGSFIKTNKMLLLR